MRQLLVNSFSELKPYKAALKEQLSYVESIVKDPDVPYQLNFLEHEPVYTKGRTFEAEHLLLSEIELRERGYDVAEVSRGGSVTYHGPGQLVIYLHIHLKELKLSLKKFLEI